MDDNPAASPDARATSMLPPLIVAWVGIAIRSPGAGYGMARRTANALGSTAPGTLSLPWPVR